MLIAAQRGPLCYHQKTALKNAPAFIPATREQSSDFKSAVDQQSKDDEETEAFGNCLGHQRFPYPGSGPATIISKIQARQQYLADQSLGRISKARKGRLPAPLAWLVDKISAALPSPRQPLSQRLAKAQQANMPRRIILVRHGESEANTDPAMYACTPDNQIPLTPLGAEQAQALGRRLRAMLGDQRVVFFVSPLRRTRETLLNILEAFDPKQYWVEEDPRLREQEWGNLQELRKQEEQLQQRGVVGRFYYRFPQGESGGDVFNRVASFWNAFFRDTNAQHWAKRLGPVDSYVIVTHGLTLRLLCMNYFRWGVEHFLTVQNPGNCEHWVMEKDPQHRYHLRIPPPEPRRPGDPEQTGDSAVDFLGMNL